MREKGRLKVGFGACLHNLLWAFGCCNQTPSYKINKVLRGFQGNLLFPFLRLKKKPCLGFSAGEEGLGLSEDFRNRRGDQCYVIPTAKGVCRQQGYRGSPYMYIRCSEGACSSLGCCSSASAEPNPPTGLPHQIALPYDGAR